MPIKMDFKKGKEKRLKPRPDVKKLQHSEDKYHKLGQIKKKNKIKQKQILY